MAGDLLSRQQPASNNEKSVFNSMEITESNVMPLNHRNVIVSLLCVTSCPSTNIAQLPAKIFPSIFGSHLICLSLALRAGVFFCHTTEFNFRFIAVVKYCFVNIGLFSFHFIVIRRCNRNFSHFSSSFSLLLVVLLLVVLCLCAQSRAFILFSRR